MTTGLLHMPRPGNQSLLGPPAPCTASSACFLVLFRFEAFTKKFVHFYYMRSGIAGIIPDLRKIRPNL